MKKTTQGKKTQSKKTKTQESTEIDFKSYYEMLGKRIKDLRIKGGWSNYENFAFEHEIGRAQYGKYEKGGNIQFDTLLRILNAHKMSLTEFFSEGFD